MGWRDPRDYGRNIGAQLSRFGALRERFGVPQSYIRHAGAFADVITIAALAPANTIIVPSTGTQVQQRYRIMLRVTDPSGGAAGEPRGIRFQVLASLENDTIVRSVFVGAAQGGVTTIYAEGRTLQITGENLANAVLQVNVSIDEADPNAPGFTTWRAVQYMEHIAAPTALNVPPFCRAIVVLSPTGTPAPTLTGNNGVAVTDYSEALAVPRTTEIPLNPGLFYLLTPAGGAPRSHVIHYLCEG